MMLKSATIIFWIVVIFGSFIGLKYSKSRNRHLFFKQGSYRAFVYSLGLILIFSFLILWIIPPEPFDLSFLRFHSDIITDGLKNNSGPEKYIYQALSIFTELNAIGLIFAFLILYIWLYYLRSLDFFNRENLTITILALLLGMVVTFFTFPLSDFVHGFFNIAYSENTFYNLFVYSFIGIGIVEELIKLIPVVIILLFTKEIDEPIDLIYYAAISALGFAFIENLIYFRDPSESILVARALTSAVGHMVDSSIVVYGIILYKFKSDRDKAFIIPYYFLLGAFAHALYDYFLFEGLIFFFFIAFAFLIQAWAIMINNAINNSRYFDYSISHKHDAVKFNLAIFFTILILLDFTINGFLVGKDDALASFVNSLVWTSSLLIFYISSISSFDLFQGYWRPVKIKFTSPSNQALPFARVISIIRTLFTLNTIVPLNIVGKKIKLHSPRYNKELCEIFHTGEGEVLDRIELDYDDGKKDQDWFLVKLTTPFNVIQDYEDDLILIKPRSKYQSLVHDKHISCWLKVIPKGLNDVSRKKSANYLSYGYITINGEDYEFENSEVKFSSDQYIIANDGQR